MLQVDVHLTAQQIIRIQHSARFLATLFMFFMLSNWTERIRCWRCKMQTLGINTRSVVLATWMTPSGRLVHIFLSYALKKNCFWGGGVMNSQYWCIFLAGRVRLRKQIWRMQIWIWLRGLTLGPHLGSSFFSRQYTTSSTWNTLQAIHFSEDWGVLSTWVKIVWGGFFFFFWKTFEEMFLQRTSELHFFRSIDLRLHPIHR